MNDNSSQTATLGQVMNIFVLAVHQSKGYSIWSMPTGKELGPSRSAGPNYEYSCIHEPIVPHIVVTFKPMLVPHAHG